MAHHPAAIAVEVSPIVIPQGGDFSMGWLYAEGAPAAAPTGWAGSWTATLRIHETRGGDVLQTVTSSVGSGARITLGTATAHGITGVVDGATIATITVAVPGATSSSWTWIERPYPFDLTLVGPGARTLRFVEGNVILSEAVTG